MVSLFFYNLSILWFSILETILPFNIKCSATFSIQFRSFLYSFSVEDIFLKNRVILPITLLNMIWPVGQNKTVKAKLFLPFQAFFIQKLSFNYLKFAIEPILRKIVHDQEIAHLRVKFEFNEAHIVPVKYINRLIDYSKEIVEMLNIYLNRVPISIRKVLSMISSKQLKIASSTFSKKYLATFFFISSCLAPVIRKPQLLGVDFNEDKQFIFDDLSNIFLLQNFEIHKIPYPFMVAVKSIVDQIDFKISYLMDLLINSVHDLDSKSPQSNFPLPTPPNTFHKKRNDFKSQMKSFNFSELNEAVFQNSGDQYQKYSSFMPFRYLLFSFNF